MGSMPLTQLWQRHVSQTSIVREGHQKALGPGTRLGQGWRSHLLQCLPAPFQPISSPGPCPGGASFLDPGPQVGQ